jgi:hypothetical protein
MTTSEIIKELNRREVFFRIENNDDGFWITHIDRSKFPRIWVDNNTDNAPTMLAETVEHTLQRCSPLAEKDWRERFFNEDYDQLIKEFAEYIFK